MTTNLLRIDDTLRTDVFRVFHQSMIKHSRLERLNHTMIGFNYIEDKITSIKFYYVFKPEQCSAPICAIPALADAYSACIRSASWPALQGRLSSGSGITYAIKFDQRLNHTTGFFFKVSRPNNELARNISNAYPQFQLENCDFYDGYGQYVLERKGDILRSEYLYLRSPRKLSELELVSDISFSRSECIEITAAGCRDKSKHKFISYGGSELMMEGFIRKIPPSLLLFLNKARWQFCCPAYAPEIGQSTVYVVGKITGGVFMSSPIDDLASKKNISLATLS